MINLRCMIVVMVMRMVVHDTKLRKDDDRCADMQICRWASVQIFNYADVQLCNMQMCQIICILHIFESAHLLMVIRFSFYNTVSTVQLFYKK